MDKITFLKNLSQEDINIEMELFLSALYLKYGYDFRDYSKAHIKRRFIDIFLESDFENFSQMLNSLLYNKKFFDKVIHALSINYTEMFREEEFYKVFRERIIPILDTFPHIKIWIAGCSTGEEVYSIAILLKEENIYDKCTIYATDFNQDVLTIAKEGIYKDNCFEDYEKKYKNSGGKKSLSDYYVSQYERIILDKSLRKNILFAEHNLVTDASFGEMNVIICKNVLIYFNKELQNKTIKLFRESLILGGYLCIGNKENLLTSDQYKNFEEFDYHTKIYKYIKYGR